MARSILGCLRIVWLTIPIFGMAVLNGQTVDVTSYGANPNGTNAAATTAAFQSAFAAAAPVGKVTIPPGNYAIDNSAGPLTINNFQGEVKFDGNAELVFASNSQSGMVFSSGNGLRVAGFHSTYANAPVSVNTNVAGLSFIGTTNTVVNDVMVEQSPGVGILISGSQAPKVANATALNPQGNGIQFVNSPNAELVNGTATGAGQDGIVFQTQSGTSGADGAHATNLVANGTGGRGIAVYGESSVTISGFTTYSTVGGGIFCGSNSSSASPDRVMYQAGLIENSGALGIEVKTARSCAFANIQVITPAGRGVSGTAPGGSIDLRNIRVSSNASDDGFNFSSVGTVRISDCSAEGSPGYGFFFNDVQAALATSLTTNNVSTANSLHRAIWFQNGLSAVAFDLTVIDNQASPTGYIVGTSQITSGSLHSIASSIQNGTLATQTRNSGVSVSSVN